MQLCFIIYNENKAWYLRRSLDIPPSFFFIENRQSTIDNQPFPHVLQILPDELPQPWQRFVGPALGVEGEQRPRWEAAGVKGADDVGGVAEIYISV